MIRAETQWILKDRRGRTFTLFSSYDQAARAYTLQLASSDGRKTTRLVHEFATLEALDEWTRLAQAQLMWRIEQREA